MPESSDNSKCSSRPGESPMAAAERRRRLSSGENPSIIGEHGRFKKIAARLTLKISRRNNKNCFSIASAFSECVRMDEKSRSTSSVCAVLTKRSAASGSVVARAKIAVLPAGTLTVARGIVGGSNKRSSNELKSRVRTGLVRTCVTPCKKASSSHADSLSTV